MKPFKGKSVQFGHHGVLPSLHVVFFCPQCLQYKTDQAQDVKKIEKLYGKLMRLMVSKETHSGAMETD